MLYISFCQCNQVEASWKRSMYVIYTSFLCGDGLRIRSPLIYPLGVLIEETKYENTTVQGRKS